MYTQNCEVVSRFVIGLNALDYSVIDRLVSPRYISHVEGVPNDKAEWKQKLRTDHAAYREFFSMIDDVYEESGRVYAVITEDYMQIGYVKGDPPDFIRYRMTFVESYRVENGLITEIFPTTVLNLERVDE